MTRRSCLVAAVVFACLGCDLLGPKKEYRDPLTFEIREGYYVDSPPPPQIALIVTTETKYSCFNYWLESEFHSSGRLLQVALTHNVHVPSVCLTAIGPAQYRVALPVTSGMYTLEFTRDGATDRYTVTVTDTRIYVATIVSSFTRPSAASFPRGG